MDDIRVVRANLKIDFESVTEANIKGFKDEFYSFAESSDDPISQWIRLANARGETKESDHIVLTLLVELHRKVDKVLEKLENREKSHLSLLNSCQVRAIGFNHFQIESQVFVGGVEYYGRIDLPTFPKREVAIFFKALSSNMAKIESMHERDIKDWDSYIVATERALIREMKGKDV